MRLMLNPYCKGVRVPSQTAPRESPDLNTNQTYRQQQEEEATAAATQHCQLLLRSSWPTSPLASGTFSVSALCLRLRRRKSDCVKKWHCLSLPFSKSCPTHACSTTRQPLTWLVGSLGGAGHQRHRPQKARQGAAGQSTERTRGRSTCCHRW